MNPIPKIITISELKKNTATHVATARETPEPVVIMQRGKPAVVLIDVDAWEKMYEKTRLLEMMITAEKEIAAGVLFDADDVFTQMHSKLNVAACA